MYYLWVKNADRYDDEGNLITRKWISVGIFRPSPLWSEAFIHFKSVYGEENLKYRFVEKRRAGGY